MWAIFPTDKHTKAVIELMTATLPHQGSERIVAIVGGSLLEDALETTLRERLLNNKGLVDSLLDFDKPLGSMGPQIDLLHLLGAFDEKTRSAMKGIARIRNYFAHSMDASFNSSEKHFVDNFKRLTLHENITHYPHHLFGPDSDVLIEPVNSPQDQYIVNLKLALLFLMRDRVSHQPHSNCILTEAQLLEKYPMRYEKEPPGGR
jgi:DNA-binding MltR family transcriptional regulator